MLDKKLDLTRDSIFSTPIKKDNRYNFYYDFVDTDPLYSTQDYGYSCIRCGGKINYYSINEDLWFFIELQTKPFSEHIDGFFELRELCSVCESEMDREFSSKKVGELVALMSPSQNNLNRFKELSYTPPNRDIRKENQMYNVEREKYIFWAKLNNKDIW